MRVLSIRSTKSVVFLAAIVASSNACAASVKQTPPIDLTERIALAESRIQRNNIELESVERARRVPGFGGHWFDKEHNLHAYLVNLRDSAKLGADVATIVEREKRYAQRTDRIVFEQGQYDFRELLMWRRALYRVLLIPGAQSLSISHSRNRVRIGIVTPSAMALVMEHARALGVPADALVIEEEEPVFPL